MFGGVLITLSFATLPLCGAPRAMDTAPVRLAMLSDGDAAREAADVLTAQLSGRDGLELLERNDLERVRREQALSATGGDALKLGRLLGADGVLLVSVVADGTNHFLASRLIAVRPGVVLAADRVASPPSTPVEWAAWAGRWLEPLLPKLRVTREAAVPISVVALRSAGRSRAAEALERQLTLLTLERLTRERDLFVLERRRLETLKAEQELQGVDDAAFWNGSWLLEGVLDRDGYSEAAITVHARLLPARGGAPVTFELRHARADRAGLVDALARQVQAVLKPGVESAAWNPDDEAQRFLEEARWALKWGMYDEAEMASEAAWALGLQDEAAALTRVRARLAALEITVPGEDSESARSSFTSEDPADLEAEEARLRRDHPGALYLERRGNTLKWTTAIAAPTAETLHRARETLELYGDPGRRLAADGPALDSPWYPLGVRALTATSRVLHYFQGTSKVQSEEAELLVEVRRAARQVAEWIGRSPSIRDSYWVGSRRATHDVLAHSIAEDWNLFKCKVTWGCLWQERPEDGVALYRDLLGSPVFCYIHRHFWLRDTLPPRLVAWTPEDRRRCPAVWQAFFSELAASTNFLHRMEAAALGMVDAPDAEALERSFRGLCNTLVENRAAFVAHNVDLTYLAWDIGSALDSMGGGDGAESVREAITRRWQTDYAAQIEAMELEYWSPSRLVTPALGPTTRTNFSAARLTHTPALSGSTSTAKASPSLLSPSPLNAPHATPSNATAAAKEYLWPPRPRRKPSRPPLRVTRFAAIPRQVPGADSRRGFTVVAQRWHDGRLWLDARTKGSSMVAELVGQEGFLAVWTPAGDTWQVMGYPADAIVDDFAVLDDVLYVACRWWEIGTSPKHTGGSARRIPDPLAVRDPVESSDESELRRFDMHEGRWTTLAGPSQPIDRLFAWHGRLLAVNSNSVWEIQGAGGQTRVLASTRRRPPTSALDSCESLGRARLTSGTEGSLRAVVHRQVWSWDGRDWQEVCSFPFLPTAEGFNTGILLRSGLHSGDRPTAWWLPASASKAELIWDEPWVGAQLRANPPREMAEVPRDPSPRPRWRAPRDLTLANTVVTPTPQGFWFLLDQCTQSNDIRGWKALENEGRHADLICLDTELPEPLVVPLRFATERAPAPSGPRSWVHAPENALPRLTLTTDSLLIGHPFLPGVWVLPRAEIDAVLSLEKRQVLEAARRRRAPALAKYDHDHDGQVAGTERGEAIDDPLFLEAELDAIASSLLGWLEARDLEFFDVDRDGQLEARELAGMQSAQRLLAARALVEYDLNASGGIDRGEALAVERSARLPFRPPSQFNTADTDHSQELDLAEFESFLAEETLADLRPRSAPGPLRRPAGPAGSAASSTGSPSVLKRYAEEYWKRVGRTAAATDVRGLRTTAGQPEETP